MFYFAKFLQGAGMLIVLIGFLARFPRLMDTKVFAFGGLLFLSGWLLQTYGVKK